MKPILINSSVYRLGTHIENYSMIQMMHLSSKARFFKNDMDYKFICGTNLLQNHLEHLHPQFMLNPFNMGLYKDSVLVGVGKNKKYEKIDAFTKYLYLHTLSKEFMHSVRDEATKKVIEDIGLKAINTGCPTLWGFTKEKCSNIPVEKAENVIFSVSGYSTQRAEKEDSVMIKCLINNYNRLYAWIQTMADEEYLRELVDIDRYKITCIYSLEMYSELLKKGNIDYIGTRLHGGIFALQHGCRSLIISIDERAEGFHETNNIPILRRNEIDKLDSYINKPILTDIVIDRSAIEDFIAQFI